MIVFVLFSATAAAQETTLFDPAKHSLTPAGARGKGQRADTDEYAKLTWNPGAKRLMEALVQHKPPLLAFDDGVELKIRVNTDGYPELTSFGIRVLDANDETYQFGGLTIPKGDGWKTLTVKLDDAGRVSALGWGRRRTPRAGQARPPAGPAVHGTGRKPHAVALRGSRYGRAQRVRS